MPRFAANLTLLYNEHAFLDRFEAAARDGFTAVEILFPYEFDATVVAEQLRANGLEAVLINAPPGNWAAGERGLAALPGREAEFRASVERALSYAQTIACPRIHMMSGIANESGREVWIANLRWAAEQAATAQITLTVEPLNPRDMPGYFLRTQGQALELIEAVGAPNLGLQMDWYHCQITEGDVTTKLRQIHASGRLAHVQLASVPLRQEPIDGELRVEGLLGLLDELGYAGWVGCEYRPRAGTSAGLAWLDRFR